MRKTAKIDEQYIVKEKHEYVPSGTIIIKYRKDREDIYFRPQRAKKAQKITKDEYIKIREYKEIAEEVEKEEEEKKKYRKYTYVISARYDSPRGKSHDVEREYIISSPKPLTEEEIKDLIAYYDREMYFWLISPETKYEIKGYEEEETEEEVYEEVKLLEYRH